MKVLFVISSIILLLNSCSQQESKGYDQNATNGIQYEMFDAESNEPKSKESRMVKNESQLVEEDSNQQGFSKQLKKIIKDGSISIRTKNIEASKTAIDHKLKQCKAYYENEDLANDEYAITYFLKIRIPSENFEKLISGIESGKDEITNKSIQARDVTEQFIDLETRLSNKREYLKRYKELLAKAANVKDILTIEENIRAITEEIESVEGRLNYLKDQVSFSTLNITLTQEKEYVYKPQEEDKFSEKLKKSLANGWSAILSLILGMVTLWPFLLLAAGIFILIKQIRKKRKQKNNG